MSRFGTLTESAFTRQVIDLAHLFGWKVAHFRPGMNRRGQWQTAVQGDGAGFPDLVLVNRRLGRVIFAELKVKAKLTTAQMDWLFWLEPCNVEAVVWRPEDWPDIERTLNPGRA